MKALWELLKFLVGRIGDMLFAYELANRIEDLWDTIRTIEQQMTLERIGYVDAPRVAMEVN